MPFPRLIPHPSTPCPAIRRFEVRVGRTPEGMLTLDYSIEGDVSRLRIPGLGVSRRADGLWRHTCCEAFLALPGDTGYLEFNFAPSTEWAVYRFDAYRTGMAAVETAAPRIAYRTHSDRLELAASLDLSQLASGLETAELRLALSAVIEALDGTLAYWALAHPPGKPDFHHPDGFKLRLGPSDPRCNDIK